MPSRTRLRVSRVIPKRDPPAPCWYAHASSGNASERAAGISSALAAIVSSRHAYVRSAVRSSNLRERRPPTRAPNARPPMNAASTVPIAATVCPMYSSRSRDHATSYMSAATPDRQYRPTNRRRAFMRQCTRRERARRRRAKATTAGDLRRRAQPVACLTWNVKRRGGACPRTAHSSHPTAHSPRGGDPGVLGEKP